MLNIIDTYHMDHFCVSLVEAFEIRQTDCAFVHIQVEE